MATFDIIEYMSGLTGFVLDESVLKRIALERGVQEVTAYAQLTQRDKDLLTADILFTVLLSGNNIPSFQHQHGQFSTSTGQQIIKDKDSIINILRNYYGKYGDEKLELVPTSSLQWMP
jgi:hypothetical protein